MADLNKKDQEVTEDVVSTEKTEQVEKTEKKDKKAAKAKNKKPNIFKRLGKYLRDCVSELHKVTWLSRKETVKSSIVVIVLTVILCALIGVLDTVLELGVVGLRDLGSFMR